MNSLETDVHIKLGIWYMMDGGELLNKYLMCRVDTISFSERKNGYFLILFIGNKFQKAWNTKYKNKTLQL